MLLSFFYIESHAGIADLDPDLVRCTAQMDRDMGCSTVLHRVAEGFLCDTEKTKRNISR